MVKLATPHEPLPEVSEFVSEDSLPEVERSNAACLRRTHRFSALHLLLPLLKKNWRILKPNGSLAVPLIPRSANKSMASKQESPMRSQRSGIFDTAVTLMSKTKKKPLNISSTALPQKEICSWPSEWSVVRPSRFDRANKTEWAVQGRTRYQEPRNTTDAGCRKNRQRSWRWHSWQTGRAKTLPLSSLQMLHIRYPLSGLCPWVLVLTFQLPSGHEWHGRLVPPCHRFLSECWQRPLLASMWRAEWNLHTWFVATWELLERHSIFWVEDPTSLKPPFQLLLAVSAPVWSYHQIWSYVPCFTYRFCHHSGWRNCNQPTHHSGTISKASGYTRYGSDIVGLHSKRNGT